MPSKPRTRRPNQPKLKTVEYMLQNGKRTETGCLEWQGIRSVDNYGIVSHAGQNWGAHRLMWRLKHGHPHPKMFVCHKCDNPACFEIDHLFLGTAKDNALDAARKGRSTQMRNTHCPKGHERTPENTNIVFIRASGNPKRECRPCRLEHARKCARRKQAAKLSSSEVGEK